MISSHNSIPVILFNYSLSKCKLANGINILKNIIKYMNNKEKENTPETTSAN